MRLHTVQSKNATSLYIIESVYTKDKKRTSRIVKKLGTMAELSKIHEDPIAWGKALAKQMTAEAKQQKQKISVTYDPLKQIPMGNQTLFNGGYLFLQKIYYALGLDQICRNISKQYKFEYDLNDILRMLLYGRILFPGSKKACFEDAKKLLEPPAFQQHHIYRALEIIAKESSFIQSELYKNSKSVLKRSDNILFYDCTNFFFEIEQEQGLKQYGLSKEHRPNPIVQMGLFMDADGIPMAFSIQPGNTNEQVTLKPLEQQIIRDFDKSRLVVCTDAGLSSFANRQFNNIGQRAFITTQSLKKLKGFQKQWALDPDGWKRFGSDEIFHLNKLKADPVLQEQFWDQTFYKERWFNEGGLEQRYIVTFSFKYMAYMYNIRQKQLARAKKMVESGQIKRQHSNDPARFLKQIFFDEDGVICDQSLSFLNEQSIQNEAQYDGFYCSATNLEDEASFILKVNRRRWEIEESFRILKSEFKARPVYLSRDDRIMAHFMTCFLALYLFRILEKKLGERFSCEAITQTLRQMNFLELAQGDFIPAYKRNELTDCLHDSFGFNTDYEILKISDMRKIIRDSKKA